MDKPTTPYGGVGWICGSPQDYDREYCIDLEQLSTFLRTTQPETAASLSLDENGPTRRTFLARLEREITNRGIIDVLRKGIKHGGLKIDYLWKQILTRESLTNIIENYAQVVVFKDKKTGQNQ